MYILYIYIYVYNYLYLPPLYPQSPSIKHALLKWWLVSTPFFGPRWSPGRLIVWPSASPGRPRWVDNNSERRRAGQPEIATEMGGSMVEIGVPL